MSWCFIVAHPGHELRAHHLLECLRPSVAVITDGSGGTGESRLDETRALLEGVDASPADLFGAMTDGEAYAAIMNGNAEPFLALVDALAQTIVSRRSTAVVIDAVEGYNPVHDVCHWMGRAAVARAAAQGAAIEPFELDLVAHPDGAGAGVRVALDEAAFGRKLAAAERYTALSGEAAAAYTEHGIDAFRVEFIRRLGTVEPPPASWVPYYEQVGEDRVKAGRYSRVLRYAEHVRPILTALALTMAGQHDGAVGTAHQ